MPESIFSGATQFEYADAGTGYAAPVVLAPAKADSESAPEQPSDEVTTEGQTLFAGEFTNETIRVYDLTTYAALRTKMLADDRVDLRHTDIAGNVNDVALDFIPRVRKPNNYNPGQRRFYELLVRKFLIT